ncbi:MAG TPA: glycosyl transferase [Pricia antarctica]|uniref:Glycosyl transferase n=1 Tax=Pricia antarctica TaxID=641691 RepID=A0A831QRX2_9FLAO|nr:glycosyl transferase [Pricia antarctica]
MKKFFKKIYRSSPIIKNLFLTGLKLRKYYRIHCLSEEAFTKKKFKEGLGYDLDLENPISLNEKINWLILNDRTPLHTLCADKFKVREHISKKIGSQYLVPLVFHTESASDLSNKNIPDYPVIIKTNHNSFGYEIINNKYDINWDPIREKFQKLLKINYYDASKQWQYKNIKPLIIVEKLLKDSDGNIPKDYKLHCFNGLVRMVSVDINRSKPTHSRSWYNKNWKKEPYSWSNKRRTGGFTDPLQEELEKPASFDLMIKLSEKLAQDFDYVRVDWYNLDGKLYFGELTFHHSGGRCPILPKEWDVKLGEELVLIKSKQLTN